MKKIFTLAILFVLVFSSFSGIAKAATNYNDVIDDAIFDNSSSMNAAQIDTFLNTFPNSCISVSNGFSAPEPIGYNPTNKFQYGNLVSAGQVIFDISQAYGINPEVFITTLQKEQGLVVGDGGNVVRSGPDNKNCGALAMSAAVGYNCPDSQRLSNYSGFAIYAYRGTPITSVDQTCVQHAAYVGFSQQLVISAWQLSFDRHRSEGQNDWYVNKPNWDNSDDLSFCYSGFMAKGGPFYTCPTRINSAPALNYSGLYSIDGASVQMDNGATAALYDYTPHLHGQSLFDTFFTTWFGSPQLACGTNEPVLPQVYILYNPRTYDHFYTTYQCEINLLTNTLGYANQGPIFNDSPSTQANTVPVYRLYNRNTYMHFWTTSLDEANNATQHGGGYALEGVAFYVASTNGSPINPVYRLYNPHTFQHVWTPSPAVINLITQPSNGFQLEGPSFYTY